jgi:hypothetical protein
MQGVLGRALAHGFRRIAEVVGHLPNVHWVNRLNALGTSHVRPETDL